MTRPTAENPRKEKSPVEPVLLTPEEAAEALKVGRCTVYDLIRTGQLASGKIGKLRRIPVEAVREFAKRMLDESGDAA